MKDDTLKNVRELLISLGDYTGNIDKRTGIDRSEVVLEVTKAMNARIVEAQTEPGIVIYQHEGTKEFLFVVSGFDGSHNLESFRRLYDKMKTADIKQRGLLHTQRKVTT